MMKIMDYLNEERVISDLQGTDKPSILRELSSVLVKPCQVTSVEELLRIPPGTRKAGIDGMEKELPFPMAV